MEIKNGYYFKKETILLLVYWEPTAESHEGIYSQLFQSCCFAAHVSQNADSSGGRLPSRMIKWLVLPVVDSFDLKGAGKSERNKSNDGTATHYPKK